MAGVVVPHGWYRAEANLNELWRKKWGGWPTPEQATQLGKYGAVAKNAINAGNEEDFENAWGQIEFFIRLRRLPTAQDLTQIRTRAREAVADHTRTYYANKPSALEDIGNAVSSIPVVGDIAHIAGEAAAAPFNFAKAVATGERIDHALVGALTDQLKIIKDVAPYAQTVVSLVPGLGTGVSMAIGAGAALAQGQNITDAAKAAIRGAIPGGAIAQAGFDAALKIASGENVGKVALETARAQLPAAAQKAFDIGTAVVTGEKIQTALANGLASIAPGQLQAVLAAGKNALASTPGLSDALKLVPAGEAAQGFQLAAGLLSHSGINEKALAAVRNQLPAAVQQGFDTALKSQTKRIAWLANVTSGPRTPPTMRSPAATALQQLASLTPAQQKQLVDLQALSKLTPEQQKQLVALTVKKPAAVPGMPAAKTTAAPAASAQRTASMPYAPYPKNMQTGVSAPPPHPHSPHHPGHPSFHPARTFRGGSGGPGWWWDQPHSPEVVTRTETCQTWGNPIDMPPAMQTAAKVALSVSKGQPASARGPDNVLYLFAVENGVTTARPCAAVGVGALSGPGGYAPYPA